MEVDAPEDLAYDEVRADALITVRARSSSTVAAGPPSAEILIMDRSLSMAGQGKLDEAKRAAFAAIDALPDGTYLGIVAGHHRAEVVYPLTGSLARVDDAARAEAKLRVGNLLPEGGTAIGKWLTCAAQLFTSVAPDSVRHAVLYTDGKDEHETPDELGDVLRECGDHFVCDARGLGHDWNYTELLRITQALHGDAQAVLDVSSLTRDFTQLMDEARRRVVPRVYLGLRLNERVWLGFVRQTRPVEAELTAQQQRHDSEIHIPLGSWAPEARQYQVSLRFDPETLTVDEDLRAARITLHAEQPDTTRQPCAETQPLVVRRRAMPRSKTRQPESLTRVESERELGMAMRACADAMQKRDPDLEGADRELRLAVELAEELGDAARLEVLHQVSVTGPDGRLQVRRNLDRGHLQRLGLESTRTGAPPEDPVELSPAEGTRQRRCPRCHTTTSARFPTYCEECGHRFDDEPVDRPSADAS